MNIGDRVVMNYPKGMGDKYNGNKGTIIKALATDPNPRKWQIEWDELIFAAWSTETSTKTGELEENLLLETESE